MTNIEPIALMPLNVRVDAVYIEDNGKLFRTPVLGLGIFRYTETEYGISYNEIEFVESDSTGCLDNPTMATNFIGFEFNGKKRKWKEEIKCQKRRTESHSEALKSPDEGAGT